MTFHTDLKPIFGSKQSKLSRILAHFPEQGDPGELIRFSVRIAQQFQASLRGLTLVNTENLESSFTNVESAAFAVYEYERITDRKVQREQVRVDFSQACLDAGLDFDLQRRQGPLSNVLKRESRFHDLTVTSIPSSKSEKTKNELTPEQIVEMVLGGVSPLIVLREKIELTPRILLVQDGTQESSRAITSFISQDLFPDAAVRLLAIGGDQFTSQQLLREQVDQIQDRVPNLEVGYQIGTADKILPDFIQQWEAGLVVIGTERRSSIFRRFQGRAVRRVLKRTDAAIYSVY
ncbi:hypothetical protein SH668x_002451 [Planctomicrobium sp. SH668]|uniref:hypothetical protein n=1 Tax=Planctomicrobium sp. SH668 TaxID=3448126 RepID=UPI003F5B326E